MSISNLIFRIAKNYGVTALGEDLGINTNTFKNKVNPNIKTHHVYAEELDLLATIADTDDIAKYFADQRGLMCITKPNYEDLSDEAILDLFLDLQAKQGEWAREISKYLEKRVMSWEDFRRVQKHYDESLVASAEVMNRLKCFVTEVEQRRVARIK